MLLDFRHPAVESFALPLIMSFVLVGLGRLLTRKYRLEAAAIGIAFLISAVIIIDRPLWPVRSALEKVPIALTGYIFLGLCLTLSAAPIRLVASLATASVLITMIWFSWTQSHRTDTMWLIAGLGLISILLVLRETTASSAWITNALKLSVAAFGLAAVVIISGSMLLGEIAVALGSAVLGYILWTYRSTCVASLAFGAVLPFVSVTALCLLLTDVSPIAIAVLIGVFFVDGFTTRTTRVSHSPPPPLSVTMRALALAGVAIGIALMPDTSPDLYYG